MAKCPSCREQVAPAAPYCPACGANLAERARGGSNFMVKRTALYVAAPIAAIILVALALLIYAGLGKKRSVLAGTVPESTQVRGSRLVGETPADSVKSAEFRARSKAIAADYMRKVDDLQEKVLRERKKLGETKRLTPEAADVLNRIESKFRDARGMIGALEGATTDESRKGVQGAIDQKLDEGRKMFGGLPN